MRLLAVACPDGLLAERLAPHGIDGIEGLDEELHEGTQPALLQYAQKLAGAQPHYDGVVAAGRGAELSVALLGLLEAADAAAAMEAEAAAEIPAGPARIEAKRAAKAKADAAAQRSRALRPRLAILLNAGGVRDSAPTDEAATLSSDPELAARCLAALDQGIAAAGAESGGGELRAEADTPAALPGVLAAPLSGKTTTLLVCRSDDAAGAGLGSQSRRFSRRFLLEHGGEGAVPAEGDVTLLRIANFLKIGLPDELIAGCAAYYEHRRLGWLRVKVNRVDYVGESDGGATYCVTAPELEGEVETVRSRLALSKPGGE